MRKRSPFVSHLPAGTVFSNLPAGTFTLLHKLLLGGGVEQRGPSAGGYYPAKGCFHALPERPSMAQHSTAQQQLGKPRRAERARRPPLNNKQAQALTHVPPPTRPPRCPVRSVLLAALRGALTGPFQRLPAVTALFLAEAALVLAHPGTPMYPAVNKYLLRRAVLDLKVSTACTTGAAWQVAHGAESACASGLRPSAGHADAV